MHNQWKSFLASAGAVLADDAVLHFGDPRAELSAAAHDDILTDLSPLTLVRISGADALTFLNNQLSNDLRRLDETHHQLAAYCTAQGRMLAILRLFRREGNYLMQLPLAVRDAAVKRLRMYVLRSKVTLEPADDLVRLGVVGPNSASRLQSIFGATPQGADGAATRGDITVLHLPGPHPRFELIAPISEAQQLWNTLADGARKVGSGIWDWLDIQAGIPTVLPATSEAFVPQMANLDLIGGISFDKGCYPGQEIVARMHYLGRLKQRLYRAHVGSPTPPQPGDPIHAPGLRGQSAGTVMNAHAAPDGGFDLLAVIQTASAEAGELHVGSENGPKLRLQTLPYQVKVADRS